MACLLIVLLFAVYNTYDAYTQMMIGAAAAASSDHGPGQFPRTCPFISQSSCGMWEILTQTPGFLSQFRTYYAAGDQKGLKEYVLSYMLSQNQGISRFTCWTKAERKSFAITSIPFLESFDESVLHLDRLVEDRQTGLGSAFQINPRHYGLTLVNSITDGNDYLGAVVSVLDMDALYQQYMAPLQLRGTVDLIVKNERGIHHHAPGVGDADI